MQGISQRRKKNGKLTEGGGHSSATTAKLITNLKVVLREAHEEGYSKNAIYTHRKFAFAQKEKPFAIYLGEEEIKALESLDLCANKRLERVRDLFILNCHTGVRFSDLQQIRFANLRNGCFEVVQQKTGNTVFIPMKIEVQEVLNKYEGVPPPKISNAKFNEYIKEACSLVPALQAMVTVKRVKGGKTITQLRRKCELIGSHTGRRSFATNEYNRGELTVREIMSATGHETEKSFFGYIRTTEKEHGENALRKIKEREAKRATFVPHLEAV
jgi:integrase